ncbi:MAG: response regulator [Spirochaetia bacterium]
MTQTILIVDDSVTARAAVDQALRGEKRTILHAVDGEDALRILSERKAAGQQVELIVTDVNMQPVNGISLTKQVRSGIFPYVPIIVITTEHDKQKTEAAKEAGATAWLNKPFDDAALISLVEQLLPEER